MIVTERVALRGRGLRPAGRRVVALVAMGGLALTALSACRSEAGSAAYVGNVRISDSYINTTLSGLPGTMSTADKISTKQAIVTYKAFDEVAAHYAADKGYGTVTPTREQLDDFAAQVGIDPVKDPNNEVVKIVAQERAWVQFLTSKTPKSAPTEADLQEVYDELVAEKQISGQTFAQLKSQIAGVPGLGAAGVLRRGLEATAKKYHVEINPRYAIPCPQGQTTCSDTRVSLLGIPTQQGSVPVMFASLGTGTDTGVIDLPSAAPTDQTAPTGNGS
jgi:hypothetical protein